jgi:non-canonical poly(A) RNA polymerase PAPD5/7
MEFFELYGKNFNYDEVGISIRKGGFYYGKRGRGWYRGGQAYLLSIEDPQDPGMHTLPKLSVRCGTDSQTTIYREDHSGSDKSNSH